MRLCLVESLLFQALLNKKKDYRVIGGCLLLLTLFDDIFPLQSYKRINNLYSFAAEPPSFHVICFGKKKLVSGSSSRDSDILIG